MTELTHDLVRKLAEWAPDDLPVTSVYLSVDGRAYPRKKDYELRLDELLRATRDQARSLPREQRRSVEKDADAVRSFVVDQFDRGSIRGLALFSSSGPGLWEEIEVSRPVRNQAVVGPHPDLLQLETLLETYESFCTALVDSEKARLFVAALGRIEDERDLVDDVPNRHDQGGWSQARFQRHVGEHRQKHLKHTADVLFRFFKRRRFDHLILAGPEEVLPEFEHELHDYLHKRIVARVSLAVTESAATVLARSLQIEEDLDRRRVRQAVDRIMAEAAAGRQAVAGLSSTLDALGDNRAGTIVVAMDLRAPGRECPSCGRLAERGQRCRRCGATTKDVPDVVEAAVAAALRQRCRVETVSEDGAFAEMGGIGALLRF
jgi:peptide chain release factor subunit 1